MKRDDVKTPEDAAAYFLTEHPEIFSEAYKVGEAIEVVISSRVFRIEIIEPIRPNPSTKNLDVRVYEKKENLWEIWRGFARCDRDSKEEVMMQALSFFWDTFREKSKS